MLPGETIGSAIARLREVQGWSQSALAKHLSALSRRKVHQDQISRWERGRRIPYPYWRRFLSELLHVPVEELSRAAASTKAGRNMAASPSRVLRADMAAMVVLSAQESAWLGERVDSTPFGPFTTTQVVEDLHRLATAYPYRPPGDSLLEARALRDRAYALAERSRRPTWTRDLYLVTAWSCGILANASFDLGAVQHAFTHARTAMHFGDLCEHRGVQTWVKGLQALIAFWDGRPDDAVAFSASALEKPPVEGGTATVLAAAIHARALAMMGRAQEADTMLARAERARELVIDTANPLDDPGGLVAFPLAKQLYWRANTYLLLEESQRLADAETAAAESIRLYLEPPAAEQRTGELCHARLDLAAARWGQGHPEGTEEQIGAVVNTLQSRYVESVVRRMERFGKLVTADAETSRLARRVLTLISAPIETPTLPGEVPALPIDE